MRALFAKTSNVSRYMAGVTAVQDRGAREASMLLVTGQPGYGKSRTVAWWATQHGAILLRAKANWTPHWMLTELLTSIGQAPKRITEDLFRQATQALGSAIRNGHPYAGIVIDEAEHAMHGFRMMETIRDLSDQMEIPIVLVGMGDIQRQVAAYPQVSSRIAKVVEFLPATQEDVRICCDTLCEVKVADDLVAELHKGSSGRYRLIMNALAVVERIGKRENREVTAKDCHGVELFHDWQDKRASKVVKLGAGA